MIVRNLLVYVFVLASISPGFADQSDDIQALQKQIQVLQEQVRKLQGQEQPVQPDGPVSRFDGRWEGKIIGDKRADCRNGDIRATVEAGKLDGTRWFFSGYNALVKGKIQPNGAYVGYQNRIDVFGQFEENTGNMWYKDGSCENIVELKKVGPL